MIRVKVLGQNVLKVVSDRLVGYLTFSDVCLVKAELRPNDIEIQLFCLGKPIYRLNVYRENPRDECY